MICVVRVVITVATLTAVANHHSHHSMAPMVSVVTVPAALVAVALNKKHNSSGMFQRFCGCSFRYSNRDLSKALLKQSNTAYQNYVVPSVYLAKKLGNMYTASLYAGLLSLIYLKCDTLVRSLSLSVTHKQTEMIVSVGLCVYEDRPVEGPGSRRLFGFLVGIVDRGGGGGKSAGFIKVRICFTTCVTTSR